MLHRILLLLVGTFMVMALSGCACNDIFDYCPTNIWAKPVQFEPMQSLIEILGTSMDGYGIYVWPSFLICALVMVGMAIASLRSLRLAKAGLTSLEATTDET